MAVPKKPTKEYLASALAEKQAQQAIQADDAILADLNTMLNSSIASSGLFQPKPKPKRRTRATANAKPTTSEQQPTLFDMRDDYQ